MLNPNLALVVRIFFGGITLLTSAVFGLTWISLWWHFVLFQVVTTCNMRCFGMSEHCRDQDNQGEIVLKQSILLVMTSSCRLTFYGANYCRWLSLLDLYVSMSLLSHKNCYRCEQIRWSEISIGVSWEDKTNRLVYKSILWKPKCSNFQPIGPWKWISIPSVKSDCAFVSARSYLICPTLLDWFSNQI